MSFIIDTSLVAAIVTSAVSLISLIIVFLKYITKLNDRLTKLETKMDLIWHYIDDNMGKILHSPHTPDIDVLIEKMPRVTIPEAERLKCLLISQYQGETDTNKTFAYSLYLARIDSLILDEREQEKK